MKAKGRKWLSFQSPDLVEKKINRKSHGNASLFCVQSINHGIQDVIYTTSVSFLYCNGLECVVSLFVIEYEERQSILFCIILPMTNPSGLDSFLNHRTLNLCHCYTLIEFVFFDPSYTIRWNENERYSVDSYLNVWVASIRDVRRLQPSAWTYAEIILSFYTWHSAKSNPKG